ncbi:phage tail tape measure protein [Paenibacillus sp. FSL L8-0158]|uniref:phage tail tape measure protein n=1 Tax=Paenibacillus sp. FSL L8-0158 TaxID=2954752 RepID=UPI0031590653
MRKAFSSITKFGVAATGLGVAVTGVSFAADSVKKAMDFESQMKTVQALTGATDEQTKAMQQLALEQGALTKYSALEAAQGIEELLKAGMSTAQVQAGGLNAALNLATAGGLGLAESAEIMSTSLNSFKRESLTAAQAADILAGTANASATDVHDLRYSLAQVGAVADQVGMSFKDTNTALGLFANNGVKGESAGTSLKTFLSNLTPMTDKAYGLFEDFNLLTVNTTDALAYMSKKGIKSTGTSVQAVTKDLEKYIAAQRGLKVGTAKSAKETKKFLTASNLVHSAFYNEKGEIKDLAQVADLLQNRFGKLTREQRQTYLYTMFGSDAIRAGNILFKEGAAGVEKFRQEMANVTALSVATKKMDSAAGAVEQFQGAIETLQISALLPTMPILKRLAQAASEFVVKYTPQITAAVQSAVTTAKTFLKDNFINNPEFTKLPDIKSKVAFAFEKIEKAFSHWWNGGGREAVEKLTAQVVQFMASSLEAAVPTFVSVGLKLGSGLIDGIQKAIANDPIASAVLNGGGGAIVGGVFGPGGALAGAAIGAGGGASNVYIGQGAKSLGSSDAVNGFFDWTNKHLPTWMGGVPDDQLAAHNAERRNKLGNKHAGGLDRVPMNGYPATLHRDEAVLTKHEASEWRDQQRGKGGSGGVNIYLGGVTINHDSDIEVLCGRLVKALSRA